MIIVGFIVITVLCLAILGISIGALVMLKEQIEELKAVNASLAAAVVAEKEEIKAVVDALKVNVAALTTLVEELTAKLAEFDGVDLTGEIENLKAIATEVQGISESL